MGERGIWTGRKLPGFVPDLFREASASDDCVVTGTMEGDVRNCAAEKDGRNRLRGVVDPAIAKESAVISSPLEEGPAELKFSPDCDLLSVEDVPPLPLRFRLMYFSISSASRSRIRVTIGDNDDVGGGGGLRNSVCEGPGEGSEKVPLLLAEEMLSGRCGGECRN